MELKTQLDLLPVFRTICLCVWPYLQVQEMHPVQNELTVHRARFLTMHFSNAECRLEIFCFRYPQDSRILVLIRQCTIHCSLIGTAPCSTPIADVAVPLPPLAPSATASADSPEGMSSKGYDRDALKALRRALRCPFLMASSSIASSRSSCVASISRLVSSYP